MKRFVLLIVAPLVTALLGQTIAAVWWASGISTAQKFMSDQLTEQKQTIDRLANRPDPNPVQDQQIQQNRDGLADVRARLSLMERAQPQAK